MNNTAYVFGANLSGFHGAGKAGLMWRGTKTNDWRDDKEFILALAELNKKIMGQPCNLTLLLGKRAVLGEIGLMKGREGYSYGLVTTERPGAQGIVTDDVLCFEIAKMLDCARKHRNIQFECLDFGLKRPEGYSWWSREEISTIWKKAVATVKFFPSNVKLPPMLS